MKKYHTEKERKLAAFRATDKWRKKHMTRVVMRLRNANLRVVHQNDSVEGVHRYLCCAVEIGLLRGRELA